MLVEGICDVIGWALALHDVVALVIIGEIVELEVRSQDIWLGMAVGFDTHDIGLAVGLGVGTGFWDIIGAEFWVIQGIELAIIWAELTPELELQMGIWNMVELDFPIICGTALVNVSHDAGDIWSFFLLSFILLVDGPLAQSFLIGTNIIWGIVETIGTMFWAIWEGQVWVGFIITLPIVNIKV